MKQLSCASNHFSQKTRHTEKLKTPNSSKTWEWWPADHQNLEVSADYKLMGPDGKAQWRGSVSCRQGVSLPCFLSTIAFPWVQKHKISANLNSRHPSLYLLLSPSLFLISLFSFCSHLETEWTPWVWLRGRGGQALALSTLDCLVFISEVLLVRQGQGESWWLCSWVCLFHPPSLF